MLTAYIPARRCAAAGTAPHAHATSMWHPPDQAHIDLSTTPANNTQKKNHTHTHTHSRVNVNAQAPSATS